MSDPTVRPPVPVTLLEVPAHQWWGTSDPPGAPLRLRVLAIDDIEVDDPGDGWVWVTGHRPGPAGDGPSYDGPPGDGSPVRVLVQLPALPGPLGRPGSP